MGSLNCTVPTFYILNVGTVPVLIPRRSWSRSDRNCQTTSLLQDSPLKLPLDLPQLPVLLLLDALPDQPPLQVPVQLRRALTQLVLLEWWKSGLSCVTIDISDRIDIHTGLTKNGQNTVKVPDGVQESETADGAVKLGNEFENNLKWDSN